MILQAMFESREPTPGPAGKVFRVDEHHWNISLGQNPHSDPNLILETNDDGVIVKGTVIKL